MNIALLAILSVLSRNRTGAPSFEFYLSTSAPHMRDMIRRIFAGLFFRNNAEVYPDHVHMTKDGILYTSPDELLQSESVRKQIRTMDSLHFKKVGKEHIDRVVE